MKKRAVLIVETGPVEGHDDDWNAWYDEVHIPEILEKIPGFHAATRYELPAGADPGPEGQDYCTVYEIEAEDPAASLAALGAGMQSGALTRTDSSSGRAKLTLWVERTPRGRSVLRSAGQAAIMLMALLSARWSASSDPLGAAARVGGARGRPVGARTAA